ncbi:hypothetical protein KOW79_003594 [Hemibagrus wyckioides]|uniref:TAFH domain-containing protein n=1 Tax=Hemibagrus wyckioides TaxID=337641 RepID=A0A9D3P3J9_9TELE|nr:hypothetical protein KOW79_003594 [Hemibagrus wyckioides]
MAGASDPLEDMLFSEVDEKAVSDLVGSLESQLVGRSGNKACSAKQHIGKPLASRANTTSEQQQQHHHHHQQQHKAGTERGSDPAEISPAGRAASPESCVKASTSGSRSHSSSSSPSPSSSSPSSTAKISGVCAQDGATSPAASISATGRRASAASGSVETPRHYGTRKKRGGGARGSAASRSVNGAATSSSVSGNSPTSAGAAVSMAMARANSATYTVSSASRSVALDKGTPTIALHRLPSHIVASIAQGRNGTSVSALIQQGRVNHGKNAESAEDKTKADVQQSQPQTQLPSPSKLQPQTPSQLQHQSTVQPQAQPQPQTQSQVQAQAQLQLQPQPRPAAPPQRITAPQLIVRPPQQQATIQLPPGFTIPSGMVLVRTELGQLMMVPQQALAQAQAQSALSPRPAAPTTTATFRVTTPQSPISVQASRVVPAVQNKVVQSQTLSPAPQTCTSTSSSSTTTTTTTTATTTTPALTRAPLAVTTPQQHPAALAPQGPTMAPPTAAGPAPGATVISQEMQENVKKCKNFLATLIKLASHNSPSPETSRNVKALVQDLLDAKIEPEEFTSRLQTELKSSPQPYLVPFLKKSLPALRLSLLNSQQSLTQPPQPKTTTTSATGAVAGAVTTGCTPRQPNSTVTPVQNIKRTGTIGGQVRMPVVITQTVRTAGGVGKSPVVVQAGKIPAAVSIQLSGAQKNKVNDPGGGSFRDDDDINDVASMAGVNLSEESARILATNSELVGTQIRSCKDEAFLPTGLLHRRILETAKKYGVTEVPLEAVNFIAHATQTRLRTVLEKVSFIAQHRMDSCKDEEWHEQSSDVRSQLKFFEHLERLEKQRKDEQEREILLKAAKSRSRQEDPEQARLKQKAKEMQQQELAQMRQRDANLTALAAIGPRKKRKVDSPGATSGTEVSGSSVGSPASSLSSSRQFHRQRITRVNLRDFIFYLEQERETSRSLLLYRALLK